LPRGKSTRGVRDRVGPGPIREECPVRARSARREAGPQMKSPSTLCPPNFF